MHMKIYLKEEVKLGRERLGTNVWSQSCVRENKYPSAGILDFK